MTEPTSDRPPTTNQPSIDEVLEAFRRAITTSALRVADEANALDARTGEVPIFGIDGVDIDLKVGLDCVDEKILVDFRAEPSVMSRIQFRVQPAPVQVGKKPRIVVVELYDERGIAGFHRYEATIRNVDGEPISGAAMTLKVRRDDRTGGQEKRIDVTSDTRGAVEFDVDTSERIVQLAHQATTTEPLPAKAAKVWRFWLESDDPVARSNEVIVHRRLRRSNDG